MKVNSAGRRSASGLPAAKGRLRTSESQPGWGRRVLRLAVPAQRLSSESGDFEEIYARLVQESGPLKGRLRYARELLLSLPAYLGEGVELRRLKRERERRGLSRKETTMTGLLQDLRYAVRALAAGPLFTLAALAALALGIGANSAIFSLVKSVLLTSLPYADPQELVMVWERNFPRNATRNVVSPANFMDWRDQNTVFESMAGFVTRTQALTGAGEPEEIRVLVATPELFSVLKARPEQGRLFQSGDGAADSPSVIVISHGLWVRRFGQDAGIVGSSVELGGQSSEIVGVLPPEFKFYSGQEEAYIPFVLNESFRRRSGRALMATARLKDGVTLQAARAEMDTIAKRLELQYPDFNSGWGVSVAPLHEDYVGDLRTSVLVLFAAVGVVLLIACANVANLLLARASTRGREMAVRMAMGAGRGRLLRQLLTESVLLALAGGLAGLALAGGAVRFLAAFLPRDIPLPAPSVDWAVAGFMAALAVLTGVLFGLAPAWEAARANLSQSLQGGRSQSGSAQSRRLRHALVVLELASALVLLAGAGLLGRSFMALQGVDLGFDPRQILTMQVQLPGSRYDPQARLAFFEESLRRFRSLPGVEAAAADAFIPMSGPGSATSYLIDEQPKPEPGQEPVADIRPVTPGYFETMGIPLLEGRDFDSRDNAEAAAVAIVNRTLAETHWPGQSPLGKTLSYSWGKMVQVRIVGVAADVLVRGPQGLLRSLLYLPNAQNNSFPFMTYVVRSNGDPLQLAPSLVAEIRQIDAAQPVSQIRPLSDYLADAVERPRLNMTLLGLFSLTALVLASVGVFGVLSYSVSRRRREIGIRMALGARPAEVLRMVIGSGLKLTAAGLALGLAGALLLGRFFSSLLFQVSPADPWTLALTALLLCFVALAACYLPARRAGKLDPIRTLRVE